MKKIRTLIAVLILVNLIMIGVVVYAASTSYTSTLSISPGSTVVGSKRDYKYNYQSISLAVDSFPAEEEPHYIVVKVGTYSSGTFTTKEKVLMHLVLNTSRYNKFENKVGTTNVQYRFYAYANAYTGDSGLGTYYSGLVSSEVIMESRSSQ